MVQGHFPALPEGLAAVLGDAYEYLINQFADDAGKKGGEFYTPRSVVRLIVELLQPQEGMRICDPTFGSAGMLIFTADYVRENGGNPQNLVLHGQERNLGTLAPNLFFGASIPVAVCVLNRDKPQERRGKVLFIDAAQEGYFRPGKAQNYIDPEHIGEIVEAYRAFEDVERFAHVADLDEIQSNDFNLNISRYADTTEPVEVMSVEAALTQLREAERRRDEAVARMDQLLAEMGYAR